MTTRHTHSIQHRIELETTPEAAHAALSTVDGLKRWWTPMVTGSPELGGLLAFRFGDGTHGADMRVLESDSARGVVWRCEGGHWDGMRFVFDVRPHERGAVLYFSHEDWPDQGDFFMHCNGKWGVFLAVSLKGYLERGRGMPHPEEPSI